MVDYETLFKRSIKHVMKLDREVLAYGDNSILTVKIKLTNDELPTAREKARLLEDPLHLRFTGMEILPDGNWWYEVTMTFVEDDS